jgi:hypothetical protein
VALTAGDELLIACLRIIGHTSTGKNICTDALMKYNVLDLM